MHWTHDGKQWEVNRQIGLYVEISWGTSSSTKHARTELAFIENDHETTVELENE